MYLLNESISDTIIVYIILKRLTKNWVDWDAYKLGIIDDKGNKLKIPVSSEERNAWTILDRFTWNVKKLMTKFIGQSKLAFMLTAAYLLKDSVNTYYKINDLQLNEELEGLTLAKQTNIYESLKLIDEIYIINESVMDMNVMEHTILKYSNRVQTLMENKNITIEDLL